MVAEHAFIEWAEVHGNLYGTALATIEEARRSGVDILLDIDCQGAKRSSSAAWRAVCVCVAPQHGRAEKAARIPFF